MGRTTIAATDEEDLSSSRSGGGGGMRNKEAVSHTHNKKCQKCQKGADE